MPHVEEIEPATSKSLPQLFVNDGPLHSSEVGLLHVSYPNQPLSELRERYERDGYLFLKGVLPRADVLKAREAYFKFLSPTGVLAPGTAPMDGTFDASKPATQFPGIGAGAVEGEQSEMFIRLALEAHSQEWYTEDLCRHPAIMDFMAKFTGWEDKTTGLRRTLLRNNIPGTKAIGVHYDQIFLRHGEPTSITAWVPIGDIKIDGGGLIYLENGAQLGEKFESDFFERACATGLPDEEAKSAFNQNMLSSGLLADGPAEFGRKYDRRWLVSAYEAGDVVLHSSYTIHASTTNHDADQVIRLATDLRFVDSSRSWDQRWANIYRLNDGV